MPHWSAKLEYDFIDFGTDTVGFPLTHDATDYRKA